MSLFHYPGTSGGQTGRVYDVHKVHGQSRFEQAGGDRVVEVDPFPRQLPGPIHGCFQQVLGDIVGVLP